MDKLIKIDQRLNKIAGKEGNPLALDTPGEKKAAEALLTKESLHFEEKQDEKGFFTVAIEAVFGNADENIVNGIKNRLSIFKKSGNSPLSVTRTFGDEKTFGASEAKPITRLEKNQEFCLNVYKGAGKLIPKTVCITKSEWEKIASPQKKSHAKAEEIGPEKLVFLSDEKMDEMSENQINDLGETISRLGRMAEKKAGIDPQKNSSTIYGSVLFEDASKRGSVGKYLLERQVVGILDAAGLLSPWKFNSGDSEAILHASVDGKTCPSQSWSFIFPTVSRWGVEYLVDGENILPLNNDMLGGCNHVQGYIDSHRTAYYGEN